MVKTTYSQEGTLSMDPSLAGYPTYTGHYTISTGEQTIPMGGILNNTFYLMVDITGSDGSNPVLAILVRSVTNSNGTQVDFANSKCLVK